MVNPEGERRGGREGGDGERREGERGGRGGGEEGKERRGGRGRFSGTERCRARVSHKCSRVCNRIRTLVLRGIPIHHHCQLGRAIGKGEVDRLSALGELMSMARTACSLASDGASYGSSASKSRCLRQRTRDGLRLPAGPTASSRRPALPCSLVRQPKKSSKCERDTGCTATGSAPLTLCAFAIAGLRVCAASRRPSSGLPSGERVAAPALRCVAHRILRPRLPPIRPRARCGRRRGRRGV